jgi:hypothetical protein
MSKYDRGDLTGARLELARNGQKKIDAGKAHGDKLWRFLMEHESALRALVAEAERPQSDEERVNEVMMGHIRESGNALIEFLDDLNTKYDAAHGAEPAADEPRTDPKAA